MVSGKTPAHVTPCSSATLRRSRRKLPEAASLPFRATALQHGDDGGADTGQSNAARASSNGDGAASELDVTLIASASLLQGQVAKNLPAFVAKHSRLENDAERALQFVRSSPGITTALVGNVAPGTRESQRPAGECSSGHDRAVR